MRKPKAKCQYCDQEFMSKQACVKHEAEFCAKRKEAEAPARRFRMTHVTATGGTVWQR